MFIISKLLFLQFGLEEANQKGIELDPVEFFIMQMNENSKYTSKLFDKVSEIIEKKEYPVT